MKGSRRKAKRMAWEMTMDSSQIESCVQKRSVSLIAAHSAALVAAGNRQATDILPGSIVRAPTKKTTAAIIPSTTKGILYWQSRGSKHDIDTDIERYSS